MARRNAALNKIASILRGACSEEFPAALVGLEQNEVKRNINKACRDVAKKILEEVPLIMDQIWLCITEGVGVAMQTAWADEEECWAFISSQLRKWAGEYNNKDDAEWIAICKTITSLLDKKEIAEAMKIWNSLQESDKKVYVTPLALNGC